MPPIAASPRRTFRPVLGFLALLAWLCAAWILWQAPPLEPRQTLSLDLPNYSFITVPDGSPVAVINPSKDELAFLDPASGRKEIVLTGDLKGVYGVIAAHDRQTLATFMTDEQVTVWHKTPGAETATFSLPATVFAAFSPDGKILAGHGAKANRVHLWDVASQKEIVVLDGHLGGAGGDFFPDSRTLATVTAQGVKLWDLATRQARLTLARPVRFYAIAPDGQSLATCDADGQVTVWDCTTGQERANYPAPDHAHNMYFSPDGSKVGFSVSYPKSSWYDRLGGSFGSPHGFELAPMSEDTVVLDAATGQSRGVVPGFASNVVFADGQTLATLSKAGDAIALWDLPPRRALQSFVAWGCMGVAVLLTGAWWYGRRARPKVQSESSLR